MAIQVTPTISGKIYLAELSEAVAKLEGDCEKKERAWVMVRQATEADNMRVSSRNSDSTFEWVKGGLVRERRKDNPRERWAFQSYVTLTDAGNITNPQGKSLFEFTQKDDYTAVKGGFNDFQEKYGSLPSVVTGAILAAVYQVNPDWDWRASDTGEEKGED